MKKHNHIYDEMAAEAEARDRANLKILIYRILQIQDLMRVRVDMIPDLKESLDYYNEILDKCHRVASSYQEVMEEIQQKEVIVFEQDTQEQKEDFDYWLMDWEEI